MVGSSLAVSTSRTAATSSASSGPWPSGALPVSPQLGRAGASLATSLSASSSAVGCHHHDPSLTHAPCTKTTLIAISSTCSQALSSLRDRPYSRADIGTRVDGGSAHHARTRRRGSEPSDWVIAAVAECRVVDG